MVRYHLKRLAMPKTWLVNRKTHKFSVRPSGSGHPFELGLPIVTLFRDFLNFADNTRETRFLLFNKGVFVDDKKIKNHKYLVGFLDVVSVPESKLYYRLVMKNGRKLDLISIDEKESKLKIKKIIGKTVLKGNKIQFNYNDGTNEISSEKFSVGDSVLWDISSKKIVEVLPLKEKMTVTLLQGQHSGEIGVIENITDKIVFVKFAEKLYEAKKQHIFVVGKTSPAVKIN